MQGGRAAVVGGCGCGYEGIGGVVVVRTRLGERCVSEVESRSQHVRRFRIAIGHLCI